ncbi:hypothetical protein ACF0H5_004401 [Mactra antiquata]
MTLVTFQSKVVNTSNPVIKYVITIDSIITVLCMPMTMLGKAYRLWIYGEVMCKLTPYLQGVSVTSSTFTITMMSLDRCLAILHPVKFRNLRTKRNVRTLLAVIWFTSALLMIPLLIVNKTKSEEIFTNFKLITCTEAWDSVVQRRAYDFSLLFIVCLGPAQIVFVSYVLMGKRLWSTDSRLDAQCDSKTTNNRTNRRGRSKSGSEKGSFHAIRASRRKTAKMCIVVSVVFVLCWLPYYTVNIYLDFKRDQDAVDIVYWSLLIGHLHCITNPILYCFMHKTFRYCVKRMLPCWRNELIRQPSCYGTNGFGGRMGSLMASSRSQRCSTYRPSGSKHGRLSSSSSNVSTASSQVASNNAQESRDEDQIVVNYNTNCNNVNPQKVKMIFKRLRHKHLHKNSSTKSKNSVDIPESIVEEVKSVSLSNLSN